MRSGIEVRDIFNTKYNNINAGPAPGINDYEISLFLTESQDELVDMYYKNTLQKEYSFEETERVTKMLSSHVISKETIPSTKELVLKRFTSYEVELDKEAWRVIHEVVVLSDIDPCINNSEAEVHVVPHNELNYTLRNPYKRPNKESIIRVDIEGKHELISHYIISKYKYRYLKRPKPFIITNLTLLEEELGYVPKVRNMTEESLCEFDYFMEDLIINRAVRKATLYYKENNLNNQIPLDSLVE